MTHSLTSGSIPLMGRTPSQNRSAFYIIGRAGASPPSRTAAIIFLYNIIYLFIYLYPYVRRALNLLRASFSPIFQYFSAVNVTRVFLFLRYFNIS